jgi:hypothetical protein
MISPAHAEPTRTMARGPAKFRVVRLMGNPWVLVVSCE